MVIGIFGESCTGKSTLADKLKESIHAQVYTGRDYLRLEKSEAAAKQSFRTKLLEAVNGEYHLCNFGKGTPAAVARWMYPRFGNSRFGNHKKALRRADAW